MSFLYSGSLWSSLYCGISLLCVGLHRWLVKVSWLGKLVLVFWWVELSFFSLECTEVSSNELWDVYGLGVTLGSLYIGAQGSVAGEFAWYVLPWNLLALLWCLVSVSVWRRFMSSCRLMFSGVRSSLVSSGFGLKPPASGFQSYFYSSLKTYPVAQMVKSLPTTQETWIWSLGWEDLLEKEMATHSSILAWKLPCMDENGRV